MPIVKLEKCPVYIAALKSNIQSSALRISISGEPRVHRLSQGRSDNKYSFYNTTEFSGLETHILNSYTNSVVQVMHYIMPIRQLAKAHITDNCPREHCLLCELGFISRMLEDACGINCQASNFCKTVGVLAQGWCFTVHIECYLV